LESGQNGIPKFQSLALYSFRILESNFGILDMKKGLVKIQANNGWLRLYWRRSGKSHYLSLGIPEGDRIGLVIAEKQAALLSADLLSDNLDPTLNKYRLSDRRTDCVSAGELMRQYLKHHGPTLQDSTKNKYRIISDQLTQVFGEMRADEVEDRQAERFRQFMLTRQEPITVRDRLCILSACWQWGKTIGAVKHDPWAAVKDRHQVPPQQRPRPFTLDEARRIIQAFQQHPHFCAYSDYVEFMLLCGFRPAEAIGLRWRHLMGEDCGVVCVTETIVRGKPGQPKRGKQRIAPIPPRIAQKLRDRRGEPDDLVFPAPEGGAMNDNNFCKRVWRPVLDTIGIPYRKPYAMRYTAASHWLEAGENPVNVAEALGYDVRTLLKYYAASVRYTPPPPDFLRPLAE